MRSRDRPYERLVAAMLVVEALPCGASLLNCQLASTVDTARRGDREIDGRSQAARQSSAARPVRWRRARRVLSRPCSSQGGVRKGSGTLGRREDICSAVNVALNGLAEAPMWREPPVNGGCPKATTSP